MAAHTANVGLRSTANIARSWSFGRLGVWSQALMVHSYRMIRGTSADQDQASLDQWPGRAHEPDDQGSDRQTVLLRSTRSARRTLGRLHQRLQLRQTAEDPEGPHALRIHLQMLDFPARTIQTQSAPQ